LVNVVVQWTNPPVIVQNTFEYVPLGLATLTVPKGSKAAYQQASYWKYFGTIVEMEE
jgi:hypothetical protein